MIKEGYKHNFETLKVACRNGDLALLECTDKETGKEVVTICAVQKVNNEYIFTPLAKMFDGNPYEELNAPA